jgi:FKBP-type peptidyl-prolyl cis-trans isomerase
MKQNLFAGLLMAALAAPLMAADTPTDPKDKNSYSIGFDIGSSLKKSGIELNQTMLAKGIADAVTGAKPALSQEEIQKTLMALQTEMRNKAMEKQKAAGEENKKAGEAFLAANKSKEGVKTTASGLQYKIITEGKGEKPKATDTVKVNYRGTLVDGTEFDSSYKRGEPITFPVNGVIPGWTEALQLMPVGSKWQLFIPSNLAYGEQGPPGIGANATLIFDVELLGIEKASEEKKPEAQK